MKNNDKEFENYENFDDGSQEFDIDNDFEGLEESLKEQAEMFGVNINKDDLNGLMEQLQKIFPPITNAEYIENLKKSGQFENSFSERKDNLDDSEVRTKIKKRMKDKESHKTLNAYATLLNEVVTTGGVDPVIGRENEIERVIQILNRRKKNNPCLIGEPGVGKTAIAQGLAYQIETEKVPSKLLNKKVYLLDVGSLIAGTQFRGQLEQRVNTLVKECKNDKDVILVIDEIHTIVGHNSMDETNSIANMIKPALANGDIQVIGTTTFDEYRKYIEKDSALERRFQPVKVEEPTQEQAIKILKGIRKFYEEYHFVKISDHLIEKIVEMSEKYVHNRFLPDKAIDIIDEASSAVNLKNTDLYKLEKMKEELQKLAEEKEERINSDSTEDYKIAAELKAKECSLIEKIEKFAPKVKPKNLTISDIAEVIERWTKIPVQKITEAESEKLLNLEKNLHKQVIGQEEAVSAVSKAIRRNRAGIQTSKKPPSFIFVGPTGVGKTELAKAVAKEMFGTEKNIIRVDMSEYMEKYSVSKLIGAPPGYVGYDEAGGLTERVRRNPYSIILFDEIEKAHPDVFNILLQVLDDGILTDSQGKTINFSNTIIIMTSNAGSDLNTNAIGFGKTSEQKKNKILNSIKENFRPEFLNRVDDIIVFDSLTDDDVLKILDIFISRVQNILKSRNITLNITEEAKKYIAKKGTDIKYGARPLKRALTNLVEDEITDLILEGKLKDGMEILVDTKNNDEILETKISKKEVDESKKINKNINSENKKYITEIAKSKENELIFSFA